MYVLQKNDALCAPKGIELKDGYVANLIFSSDLLKITEDMQGKYSLAGNYNLTPNWGKITYYDIGDIPLPITDKKFDTSGTNIWVKFEDCYLTITDSNGNKVGYSRFIWPPPSSGKNELLGMDNHKTRFILNNNNTISALRMYVYSIPVGDKILIYVGYKGDVSKGNIIVSSQYQPKIPSKFKDIMKDCKGMSSAEPTILHWKRNMTSSDIMRTTAGVVVSSILIYMLFKFV